MMKRASIALTGFVIAAWLLSACSGGGGPAIEATRAWLQALSVLNFDGVMNQTCSDAKTRDAIEQALTPYTDLQSTLKSVNGLFDYTNLKFEEKSNDGKTAIIHLSGSMILKALGQVEQLEYNEDLRVVNENNVWKVCGNPLKQ